MTKLILISIFISTSAIAAGGGHQEGAGGIPTSVYLQAINFALFVGILFYFLKKPTIGFFKQREQAYKQALAKGESARRDAEKKKREMAERLRDLESSADDSIANARAEAAALKLRIGQEAEELSQRLREDSARSTELELARATRILREEMLSQAVAVSRKMLAEQIVDTDQKRLQTEFNDKIQEVRS